MSFKKSSYDMPPSTRDNDDLTSNSQYHSSLDDAAFDPDSDKQFISARGATNHPTTRDFEKEDLETERSDQTGKIPKGSLRLCWRTCRYCLLMSALPGEVDELLSNTTEEERNASGRTRGVNVDAWKQERELDQAFNERGLAVTEEDV